MSSDASAPHVYRAINAITAAFARDGIAKAHTNLVDQYQYRSIDDVLNRLGPLLARHRLCALPRVLKRTVTEHPADGDALLVGIAVRVAYDLVSCRDGSQHTIEACGEALDPGDKATAKAMSAAFKSAMLQAFCIPVATEDADASSGRLKRASREPEPVQGWQAWSADILDIIGVCESLDALDRVRTRQGALLAALKRERPELYAGIGEGFAERIQAAGCSEGSKARTRTSQNAGNDRWLVCDCLTGSWTQGPENRGDPARLTVPGCASTIAACPDASASRSSARTSEREPMVAWLSNRPIAGASASAASITPSSTGSERLVLRANMISTLSSSQRRSQAAHPIERGCPEFPTSP